MERRRLAGLVRIAVTAAALGLCWLLLRGMHLDRVAATLRRADLRLVALAVALNLTANTVTRVYRWAVLIRPLPAARSAPSWWELCWLLLAGYATSNLVPARAGEALRVVQLRRRHGYPMGSLVAVQLVEKVVEALSIGLCAVPVALSSASPRELRTGAAVLAAIGIGAILVLLVLAWRLGERTPAAAPPVEGRVRGFLRRLGEAMHLMRSPRVWASSVGWSLLSDAVDATMIGLCLHAVGAPLGPLAWLAVLLSVNLAIAVPATPGQLGLLEAGAVLALRAFGVGQEEALAFAVLYHAAHLLPTTLLGLLGLRLHVLAPLPPALAPLPPALAPVAPPVETQSR